jgi:IS605 OrfB family transposase
MPKHFINLWQHKQEIDSITVKERNGKLIGYISLTLPDPPKQTPVTIVGVDRNETNLLVAAKNDGSVFFETGLPLKIKRKRWRKEKARLQGLLAVRRAQKKDAKSCVRLLKRLSGRQRRNTFNYCRRLAKRFVAWTGTEATIALEQLHLKQGKNGSKALNRGLSLFPHGLLNRCIGEQAEKAGIPILLVDPNCTSQLCHVCGGRGQRNRHRFLCPSCGYVGHADINAAHNILRRAYAGLWPGGLDGGQHVIKSASPEAFSCLLAGRGQAGG